MKEQWRLWSQTRCTLAAHSRASLDVSFFAFGFASVVVVVMVVVNCCYYSSRGFWLCDFWHQQEGRLVRASKTAFRWESHRTQLLRIVYDRRVVSNFFTFFGGWGEGYFLGCSGSGDHPSIGRFSQICLQVKYKSNFFLSSIFFWLPSWTMYK